MNMNPIQGRITNFDLCSLLMMLLTYVIYLILAPFFILISLPGKRARYLSHFLSRYIGKYFARVIIASHRGMKFRRKVSIGPLPRQYIMVANHLSRLDLVYSASVFALPTYIGKVELKRSVLGVPAILNGSIFVKRENKDSRKAALDALRAKAKDGYTLGIFPEGASNKVDGEPKEFKLGAFILAKEFNLPIVLAAVHDYPASHRKREVGIEVFDVLQPEAFANVEALRDQAYTRINNRLESHREAMKVSLLQKTVGQSRKPSHLIIQDSRP